MILINYENGKIEKLDKIRGKKNGQKLKIGQNWKLRQNWKLDKTEN